MLTAPACVSVLRWVSSKHTRADLDNWFYSALRQDKNIQHCLIAFCLLQRPKCSETELELSYCCLELMAQEQLWGSPWIRYFAFQSLALVEPQVIPAFILVSNLKTLRLHFQIKILTLLLFVKDVKLVRSVLVWIFSYKPCWQKQQFWHRRHLILI